MERRSEKSRELYEILQEEGYPQDFCSVVADTLNTDFTASRMIGYLSYYTAPRCEDVADEMIAILEDRDRIAQKHEYFRTNGEWNKYLNEGLESSQDER